ncbi:MAG: hypothetical protein ACOH1R_04955 [Luteimonas sp.]
MSYYFANTPPGVRFDDAIVRAEAALKAKGLGILSTSSESCSSSRISAS